MNIVIDIDHPTPVFNQLIDQIKDAVKQGGITPGSPLPSIRQLANDLDLNAKTVAKAYKLLERDSIIQTKGYRGTFIHPEALQYCSTDIKAWLDEQLVAFIGELKHKGITDSEIRIAFANIMNNKG